MDEQAAGKEVYEAARDQVPIEEEQSNDEFEDAESGCHLNEESGSKQSIGDQKNRSSSEQDQSNSQSEQGQSKSKPDESTIKQVDESNTDEQQEDVGITKNELPDSDDQFTEEELNEKLVRSTQLKDEGNAHFKSQEYERSLELYSKALAECPNKFNEKKAIILNNKAVCRWKLLQRSSDSLNFSDVAVKIEFDGIIADLSRAIELNANYFKPYLKRAEFHHRFGGDKLDNSLEDYKKVLEMLPGEDRKLRDEIRHEIAKLQAEIEERNEKLKQEMFAQLKNLGNLCLRPFGLSTDNFKLQQNESGGYSVNFQQQ